MRELTMIEIQDVNGEGVLGNIAAVFGGASAVAGGLAAVPTPATPALVSFAVVTGVLGAALGIADMMVN